MKPEYDEKEVEAKVLGCLYNDSRKSAKEISKATKLPYNKVSIALLRLERDHDLFYTLDLDLKKLGFYYEYIVCIKFETRPNIENLKRYLEKNEYVQNAYLGYGDYDLIIHAVSLDNIGRNLTFMFSVGMSKYHAHAEASSLDKLDDGFLPYSPNVIEHSTTLKPNDKKVLLALLQNSRIPLSEIVKKTGMSAPRILYIINKLKKKGIIRKMTCTVQKPDKKLFIFYTQQSDYLPEHKNGLLQNFLKAILDKENANELTTDYSVVCETSGQFTTAFFCNFMDTAAYAEIGPELLKKCWAPEHPVVKSCILTHVLKGKWPFQKNGYAFWKPELKRLNSHKIKYDLME